jgi:hypothetical protein
MLSLSHVIYIYYIVPIVLWISFTLVFSFIYRSKLRWDTVDKTRAHILIVPQDLSMVGVS